MNEQRIVLACPGAGGTKDKLIANLSSIDLLHAAKGRAHIPPERRRPFYVFLDEVQTYDGAASKGTSRRCLSRPRSTGSGGPCSTRTPSG